MRGDRHFVVLNMTDTRAVVPRLDGTLRINTDGSRIDEPVRGELALAPWEGVIGATTTR
jgi:hypothetical protein